MAHYRRIRAGSYRTSTPRRGHWRRKPTGGYTSVRPHRMGVRRVNYNHVLVQTPPPRLLISQPRTERRTPDLFRNIEDSISDTIIDKTFDISSSAFPQYSPLIETGRLLYNNRQEISNTLKILFSDKSVDTKLDGLSKIINDATMRGIKQQVVSKGAEQLTNIVESAGGFSKVNEKFDLNLTISEQHIFKNFFQSTAENLMLRS